MLTRDGLHLDDVGAGEGNNAERLKNKLSR
jgi:hypothetical protein